jgi:cbb3-type cytochrome oxidase subunit 3
MIALAGHAADSGVIDSLLPLVIAMVALALVIYLYRRDR